MMQNKESTNDPENLNVTKDVLDVSLHNALRVFDGVSPVTTIRGKEFQSNGSCQARLRIILNEMINSKIIKVDGGRIELVGVDENGLNYFWTLMQSVFGEESENTFIYAARTGQRRTEEITLFLTDVLYLNIGSNGANTSDIITSSTDNESEDSVHLVYKK